VSLHSAPVTAAPDSALVSSLIGYIESFMTVAQPTQEVTAMRHRVFLNIFFFRFSEVG